MFVFNNVRKNSPFLTNLQTKDIIKLYLSYRISPIFFHLEVKSMSVSFVFLIIAYTLLSFLNCRNSTIGMINEIGINNRFYPKGYMTLPRKIRRLFSINNKLIPKFLFSELIISILFVTLGPIYIIIYLCCDGENSVGGILLLFHSSLIIINMLFFTIMSTIYKRKND